MAILRGRHRLQMKVPPFDAALPLQPLGVCLLRLAKVRLDEREQAQLARATVFEKAKRCWIAMEAPADWPEMVTTRETLVWLGSMEP